MTKLYQCIFCLIDILSSQLIRLAAAQSCNVVNQTVSITSAFSTDPSIIRFTSCSWAFDTPHVSLINETVFDWWYFDAVFPSGTESLVVVFFTASKLGFHSSFCHFLMLPALLFLRPLTLARVSSLLTNSCGWRGSESRGRWGKRELDCSRRRIIV